MLKVNIEGVRHLLDGLARGPGLPQAIVLVSSVAVYGRDQGTLIDENEPRRAVDPYGFSKRAAEDALAAWSEQHGVRYGIVRLPLVAGRNAPGNLGAMMRALRRHAYVGVGDGLARRSLVLAPDVAAILPAVAEHGGVFHLTDGHHPTFTELERTLAGAMGRRPPSRIPLRVARTAARMGDAVEQLVARPMPLTTSRLQKMTTTLTFSDERARRALGWRPRRVVDHVKELT
jgi:nucleoside-diphosphate-sugar epimerase